MNAILCVVKSSCLLIIEFISRLLKSKVRLHNKKQSFFNANKATVDTVDIQEDTVVAMEVHPKSSR